MRFRDLFILAVGGLLGGIADVIDGRYRHAGRVWRSLWARLR